MTLFLSIDQPPKLDVNFTIHVSEFRLEMNNNIVIIIIIIIIMILFVLDSPCIRYLT